MRRDINNPLLATSDASGAGLALTRSAEQPVPCVGYQLFDVFERALNPTCRLLAPPALQCGSGTCQTKTITSTGEGDHGLAVGGWTADADVLVEPFRRVPVMKSLLLGFSPYGFFGVGGYGVRPYAAADTSVATLNYGLGAHHDLLGWLGVGVEARYRRPLHSDSALTFGAPRTWEYRLGLTASFGGGRPWRRSTIRQDPPPRSTIIEHRVYVSPAPPAPRRATPRAPSRSPNSSPTAGEIIPSKSG